MNINFINNNGQCINILKDPVTAANIFNNFFINIGKEYSEKFKNNVIGGYNVTCTFSYNELFLVPIEKYYKKFKRRNSIWFRQSVS